jgi:hypothetical protein
MSNLKGKEHGQKYPLAFVWWLNKRLVFKKFSSHIFSPAECFLHHKMETNYKKLILT